jgi:FkbM family methyltransferase
MPPSLKHRSYFFSHRIISFLRDKDVRGIRRLSVFLPKVLLPNPALVGEHVMETIHGFSLKINPSVDKGVELSLFETGTYEKGILAFLKSVLQPGDCFIDVGANIGLMSIFAARYVKETGSVFAYEAHPDTFERLNFNIVLNKVKNVKACAFALGAEEGDATLYDNWHINRGGASLQVKDENSKAFSVNVKRLDDCLPLDKIPKVIKIDVEGFEGEVLMGAEKTIRSHRPILIVEISSLRESGGKNDSLLQFMEGFGCYDLYKLSGTKERVSSLVKIETRADIPEHDNIIYLPKQDAADHRCSV